MLLLRLFLCATISVNFNVASSASETKRLAKPVEFFAEGEKIDVLDGDTLWIGIHQIRLHGIDALEPKQQCLRGNEKFLCHQEALRMLEEFSTKPKFRCVIEIGKSGKPVMRYGRYVGTCFSGDVVVNEVLVAQGWAYAANTVEGDRYRPAQARAKAMKLGLHRTEHIPPWEFRAKERGTKCTCEDE